ncbi:MAG TPA: response regulator [Acidobacteriaceae bacterium]|jgi:two-component system, cell cycle response regulator DivK|nr:response regulator [Acidobacteriaceae bacterium]
MSERGRKYLILIADDRPSSRELLRVVLERAGYEVIEAQDGEAALEEIRARKPDLVLLDLQMPRLDGYGVLKAVRGDEHLAGLPVVALTASAMRGDRERILESGFTDYLAKPAGPDLLRDTVARLLREHGAENG